MQNSNAKLVSIARDIVRIIWNDVRAGAFDVALQKMIEATDPVRALVRTATTVPGILIAVDLSLLRPPTAGIDWASIITWKDEDVGDHPWAFGRTIVRTAAEMGRSSSTKNVPSADNGGGTVSNATVPPLDDEQAQLSEDVRRVKKEALVEKLPDEEVELEDEDAAQKRRKIAQGKRKAIECKTPPREECEIKARDRLPAIILAPLPKFTALHKDAPSDVSPHSRGRSTTRRSVPAAERKPADVQRTVNSCARCLEMGLRCIPVAGKACQVCTKGKKRCSQAGKRGRSALRPRASNVDKGVAQVPLQTATIQTRSISPAEPPAKRTRRHSQSRPPTSASSTPVPLLVKKSKSAAVSAMLVDQNTIRFSRSQTIEPTAATTSRSNKTDNAKHGNESGSHANVSKASVCSPESNGGLVPGAAYTVGGSSLVSREEHHRLLLKVEEQSQDIEKLTSKLQEVLRRLADAETTVSAVGRAHESLHRSVTSTPIELDQSTVGLPTENPNEDGSSIPPSTDVAIEETSSLQALNDPLQPALPRSSPPIIRQPTVTVDQRCTDAGPSCDAMDLDTGNLNAANGITAPSSPTILPSMALASFSPPPLFPAALIPTVRSMSPVMRGASVPPIEVFPIAADVLDEQDHVDQLATNGGTGGE